MQSELLNRPPKLMRALLFGISTALPTWAFGQEEAGDQRLSFGFAQSFRAIDNIILAPESPGTTYSSETGLSFGFDNETSTQALSFSAGTIGRIVNDPLIGSDSGFRDPRLDLAYQVGTPNSQLSVIANYFRPDLAFSDPLTSDSISEADFFRGGGTRDEWSGAINFATGLEAPLGFVFDLESTRIRYEDTIDPLLFANRTDRGAVGVNLRLSPVAQGRIDYSEDRYQAEDSRSSSTDTTRLSLGLDYDVSPVSVVNLDLGRSEVTERLEDPGETVVTRGPIGALSYVRELPDGSASVEADSFLARVGRQSAVRFGRSLDLPNGSLAATFGVTQGDTFDPLPIGSIRYFNERARSRFDVSLSRTASISDILAEAIQTTRIDFGYDYAINAVSALSLDAYYADLSAIGVDSAGAARDRGSIYAVYNRSVTEDWSMLLGYELRYVDGTGDIGRGVSNGVFFSLERGFDIFR